jgi:type IX secretion system PorP/SprF family membrane protein
MRHLHFLFLFFATPLIAQQEPFFSHFFYNKLLANPGAAGSNGLPCLTAFHRQQWAGLEGAPVTQALSFNAPVLAERVGLGLTLVNDRIGLFNSTYLQAAYAYRVAVGGGRLGIGLHGSLVRRESRWEEARTISGTTTGAEGAMNGPQTLLNMGMGVHFENGRFFFGAAVPQVLDRGQSNGQVRHVFANAGAVLELSEKLRMRPAAAVRGVEHAPPSFDAHLSFGFTEEARLWLGGTLRMSQTTALGGDALVALGQYQISERLRAGLAYDMALGPVRRGNAGSFELLVEYGFVKVAPLVAALRPRYF